MIAVGPPLAANPEASLLVSTLPGLQGHYELSAFLWRIGLSDASIRHPRRPREHAALGPWMVSQALACGAVSVDDATIRACLRGANG